jgi:hypothetical protein
MSEKTPGRAARATYAALGVEENQRWELTAQAAIDWWHAERDLEPPRELAAGAPAELAAAMAERDEARGELAVIRERLRILAAQFDLSASYSHPGKKSEIEQGCAQAVRAIAEDREPEPEPRPSPAVLWEQAGGNRDLYRGLLHEHGHILAPGDDGYDPDAPRTLPCGWGPA